MVRAAEAAGLAGFAFTEHIFHLDEPRVASRYLGTRWDGELEGPPIGVDRYLARSRQPREAVPAVAVGVGLELEHWPDDPRVREVQDAFVPAHAGDWDMILGSVHCLDGRSFDLRLDDPALDRRCLGRLLRAPRRRRGARGLRRRHAPAAARRQPPRGAARPGAAARPPGRAGRRCRRGARGQRLGRARLSRARAVAVRVDRAGRRAAQPRLRRASPAQRGRGAAGHRRCCARRACAARSRSSAASGATTPFEHDAALGARAARVRDERVRRLVPADGDRAARLRAGHGDARAHARGRRRARAGRARELRRACAATACASP